MSRTAVVLITTVPSQHAQEVNCRRMLDTLSGKKIVFETVDGSNSDYTELRNRFFGISGKRAVYPQVFLVEEQDIEFVGDWEEVENMLESESLPAEILQNNPAIKTFSKAFANAKRV